MLEVIKKRAGNICGYLLLFFGGAIAGSIFAPFEGMVAGYCSLALFFAYLFSFNKIDKRVFFRAYLFSFSFFMVSFSWIVNALLVDGDSFICFVPIVLLFMGAFFGLGIAIPSYWMKWGNNRYAKALILCTGIVFFEWVRSWIFTGFPWNLFGSALLFDTRFAMGGSFVGGYGLSFVLLIFIAGLGLIVEKLRFKKFDKKALWFVGFSVVFLGGFSFSYQNFADGDIKVRLVQTDIEQTFKWNKELLYKNFRQYIDLSKSKPLDGVKLVVWGETATPYMLDRDEKHLNEIREAIAKDGFLVTGLIRASFENGEYVPYNSLFVIDDKGDIKD